MREPIKQDTLDLTLRQSYIGTSEWAVVALLHNKYKSLYDIYNDKINGYEAFDNIRMRLGRDIEPMMAKWVEEEINCKVAIDGYVRFHPDYDFLATNLDGECHHADTTRSVLEIKTASSIARESWGAELPIQYYTQIQGQMMITGLRKAHVAILTFGYAGPEKFEIQEYDYNEEFAEEVKNKCVDFWFNHIVPQHPPEATTESDIKNQFPVANGHTKEAGLEVVARVETLRNLMREKKAIEETIKDFKIEIQKEMGSANALIYEDEKIVSWNNTKARSRFDQKTFKEEHPGLFKKYQVEGSPIRTFRVK